MMRSHSAHLNIARLQANSLYDLGLLIRVSRISYQPQLQTLLEISPRSIRSFSCCRRYDVDQQLYESFSSRWQMEIVDLVLLGISFQGPHEVIHHNYQQNPAGSK